MSVQVLERQTFQTLICCVVVPWTQWALFSPTLFLFQDQVPHSLHVMKSDGYSFTASISQHLNAWFSYPDCSLHLRTFTCQIHGIWESLKWTQVALLPAYYLWQCKDLYFSYLLLLPSSFGSTKFKVKVIYPVCTESKRNGISKKMPGGIQAASEDSQQLLIFILIFSLALGIIVAVPVTFTGQDKSQLKLKVVLLIPVPGSSAWGHLCCMSSVYCCQGGNKCIHMKKLKDERERFYSTVSERCISEEP